MRKEFALYVTGVFSRFVLGLLAMLALPIFETPLALIGLLVMSINGHYPDWAGWRLTVWFDTKVMPPWLFGNWR